MTDVRKCPHCNKPLRSNNTRGVCTGCFNKGLRVDGAGTDEAPPADPSAPPAPRKKKPSGNVRKDFAVVARALGEDPDDLIDSYCENWLDELKDKRRTANDRNELANYVSPLEREA